MEQRAYNLENEKGNNMAMMVAQNRPESLLQHWAKESVFLTSSHVRPMLPAQVPHLENHCYNPCSPDSE